MCYYQDHISLFYTRSKVQSARYRTFAQRLEYARMKTLILHHSLCARCKVQDLAHLDTFKYQFLIKTLFLHHPLHSRCKVQDLAYLHTCKYYVLIKTQFLHYPLHARCTVQNASTKILSRPNFKILFLHHPLPARCKVQDLAYLHRCKFYVLIKTQFLHHPHLQGANCKILHICTSASIKFFLI